MNYFVLSSIYIKLSVHNVRTLPNVCDTFVRRQMFVRPTCSYPVKKYPINLDARRKGWEIQCRLN